MANEKIELRDVIETKLLKSSCSIRDSNIDNDINIYLKIGWRIIDRWVVGCSNSHDRLEIIYILLGWYEADENAPHPIPQEQYEDSHF